jgi:hypothetical protein
MCERCLLIYWKKRINKVLNQAPPKKLTVNYSFLITFFIFYRIRRLVRWILLPSVFPGLRLWLYPHDRNRQVFIIPDSIPDPGSSAFFDPRIRNRDRKDQDPRSWINISDHISESLVTLVAVFWVKTT